MQSIIDAIRRERAYQDMKWGTIEQHPHDVGAWLTIIRKELREAEDGWCSAHGDENALREVLQIAAVCVACLEQHGVVEREPLPFSDPPTPPDDDFGLTE